MEKVKVSIITTIYKAEKDLPRLLDSMMAVKNENIEFFLIDNGSPDGCYQICQEYAKKDSRFTVYKIEENIGYIRARNVGIEECNGNYVGFCDSDDFLCDDGYDKAIQKIEESNCDFYIGAYNLLDGDKTTLNLPPFGEGIYNKERIKEISPLFFGFYNGKARLNGFVWKNIYRKEILLKNNVRFIEKLKPYEDQIFNVDVMQNSSIITVGYEILYNYVVNSESITAKLYSSFSLKEEYERDINLYNEYEKRTVLPSEREAMCNYFLFSLYVLLLNCAKGKEKVKFYKKELKETVDKNFIKEIVKNSSKKQGKVLKLLRFCLKKRKVGLFLWIVRFAIKVRGAHGNKR